MNLPELAISLGGSVVLSLLLLLIAVALGLFYYRTTIPPLPGRTRRLLMVLRSCSLATLVLLAFEPLLKSILREERPPVLAVLIDDSESMTIKDRSLDRASRVRSLLQSNLFTNVQSDVAYFRFASQLKKLEALADSLTFRGETTDLAAALHQLKQLRTRENIQAAVLISDGMYTVGKNPVVATESFDIPLYTVGVGDTTEHRDLLIAAVTTNNIAYAETRVPVDVRVRSSGYPGQNIEVALMQGPQVVDRKLIQLQEGTRDYLVSLSLEAKEEGVQRFTVTLSKLPGELTHKNNTSSFFVKILKTKLRILILAGTPGPDLAIIKQTLSEEQHFFVKSFTQKGAGDHYEGAPTQQTLDSADCLVLIGFPSNATASNQILEVNDAIERLKKPILFVASRTLDYDKLSVLESHLPFAWTFPSTEEVQVFPEIPERQRAHSLVELGLNASPETWRQLPPVFKTQTVFRAKPESDVLAFAKVQSVVLNELLLGTRSVAGRKSLAITGHGIWRWRLLAQGNVHTEKFFSLLLTNAIRWLTAVDEGKRVRVAPTKEAFTTAEPVEFTAEVYDEQLRPVDNAEVGVELTSGSQKAETSLRGIGSGRYEGAVEGLGSGDYTFAARAVLGGKMLGEDKGKLSVGQLNVEFLETRMNKQLLEQLAFRTGGMYASIDSTSQLLDSLSVKTRFTPKEIVHTAEIELWNWEYLAGLVVILLACEWVVRKRSGML